MSPEPPKGLLQTLASLDEQTSGFGGIGAIVAANRVSRDLHVRPNVAGLGIPQMAQRPVSEDLGV